MFSRKNNNKGFFKKFGSGIFLLLFLMISTIAFDMPGQIQNQTITTQKKNNKNNNNYKQNDNKQASGDNLSDILRILFDTVDEAISSGSQETEKATEAKEEVEYHFRNKKYLSQHFEKHGGEFDYKTEEEYEAAASKVVNNPDALHKIEQEDGDDIYYLEDTNEFVVVSKDGYLRTYFKPSAGKKYYDRQ